MGSFGGVGRTRLVVGGMHKSVSGTDGEENARLQLAAVWWKGRAREERGEDMVVECVMAGKSWL